MQLRRQGGQAAAPRYLRAFEAGQPPEAICAHRLQALEREIAGLAARKAALESLGAQAPVLPDDGDLQQLRDRIRLAVAQAAPEQLKLLLAAVVDRITVESRVCVQPYFTAPGVRPRGAPREASRYAYEPRRPVTEPLDHHTGVGTGELRTKDLLPRRNLGSGLAGGRLSRSGVV
jgi:hypothetical protein